MYIFFVDLKILQKFSLENQCNSNEILNTALSPNFDYTLQIPIFTLQKYLPIGKYKNWVK